MHKVIKYFTDLQDQGHPYRVGDTFPREGKKVSDKRLKELASANNRQHTPLIEEVKEPAKSEEDEEIKIAETPKHKRRSKVD